MQTACERRNITFPSIDCNQNDGAQAEAAWRNSPSRLAVACDFIG